MAPAPSDGALRRMCGVDSSAFPSRCNPPIQRPGRFRAGGGSALRPHSKYFPLGSGRPFVIQELWLFAKSAYLDTPIPTLLKERLFVYLSRFCEVRYCITRHCGFLLGLGRSAGDPDASAITINRVTRLLQRPIPTKSTGAALARLEAIVAPVDWPSPETSYDDDLLTAATLLFLQPARAGRAKQALRIALGGEKFELLVGFLAFIRSAHYGR
jgi:hypothetical protein